MKVKKAPGGMSFYVILLAVIILLSIFMSQAGKAEETTLSDIITRINSGEISKVIVSGYTVEITERQTGNTAPKVYSKQISPMWMDRLIEILEKAEADDKIDSFDYIEPTDIASWLNIIVIMLMLGGMGVFIWFTYSRQAGDGKNAMSFGRSRAKLNDPTKNKVTFQDVAGADEEKEE
ncbi:MAG TPA: cell division protein FtsH, partial [Clostridiales bacterium]|nr:cell division protein FtsH [Clostridiales bacterium]